MILEGIGLSKRFPWGRSLTGVRAWVRALEGATLQVAEGETLALVGESGSGKTTAGRILAGIEVPTAGQVLFRGRHVAGSMGAAPRTGGASRRDYRLGVQMVFQESQASLNPRKTVGQTLDVALAARGMAPARRREAAARLLAEVGMEPVGTFLARFPHQLSGGQRQRVNVARALSTEPAVIIADEPVSALDLSVRAQILVLMERLQKQHRVAYLFISHDLAVVRSVAQRVAVMYLGRIVEEGRTEQVFATPLHPYTVALLSATPIPDPRRARLRSRIILPGDVPSPVSPPPGCPFHPRCPVAAEICGREFPPLLETGEGQKALCHFAGTLAPGASAPGRG